MMAWVSNDKLDVERRTQRTASYPMWTERTVRCKAHVRLSLNRP
jgi:hypothetical protein